MDSESTHWRQLCPSILDIEAEHGISEISYEIIVSLLTDISSAKSRHRRSVQDEESK